MKQLKHILRPLFIFLMLILAEKMIAQNQRLSSDTHDKIFNTNLVYTPLSNHNAFGFAYDYLFFFNKFYGTGFQAVWPIVSRANDYGLELRKPYFWYTNFQWKNAIKIIDTRKLISTINVSNGYASIRLDTANLKKVAVNRFYIVNPGCSFTYNFNNSLYLTAQYGYRFLFGGGAFGTNKEFWGHEFELGAVINF